MRIILSISCLVTSQILQAKKLDPQGPVNIELLQTESLMQSNSALVAENQLEASLESFQKLDQALQSQILTKIQGQGQAQSDMAVEAQWGFLKNIVNIDTFFSSGANKAEAPEPKKESLVQKKSITAKQTKLSSEEDEESLEDTQILTQKDVHISAVKSHAKKSQSKKVGKAAKKLNQATQQLDQQESHQESDATDDETKAATEVIDDMKKEESLSVAETTKAKNSTNATLTNNQTIVETKTESKQKSADSDCVNPICSTPKPDSQSRYKSKSFKKEHSSRPIVRVPRRGKSSLKDDHDSHYDVREHSIPADRLGSGDKRIPADKSDRSEHADNYGGDVIDDSPVYDPKTDHRKDDKKKENIEADVPDKKTPKEEAKSADFMFRQRRIYWLDNLSTTVFKGSNKEFLDRAEKFAVIVYQEEDTKMHDQKVQLYTGRYQFRATSYNQALDKFGDLVRPLMQKNNKMEFGLIGNRQLLFTTSVFNEKFKTKITGGTLDDINYLASGDKGVEYATDKPSKMMLAEGIKQNWIDWPEGALDSSNGYIMILESEVKEEKKEDSKDEKKEEKKDDKKEEKKAEVKFEMKDVGTNWASALRKFENATKNGKAKGVLLHSNRSWQRQSGKPTKSSQFPESLMMVADYVFSLKKENTGVQMSEETAKYKMLWQKEKKIEDKIKTINIFKGTGESFNTALYFQIIKLQKFNGQLTLAQNHRFGSLQAAYSNFIKFVRQQNSANNKNWECDFLLVGNDTALLSTAAWKSSETKIMMGYAVRNKQIHIRKTIISDKINRGPEYQYYMIVRDKKTQLTKQEALGEKGNVATQKFNAITRGAAATSDGIIYHANGNIYLVSKVQKQEGLHRGENDAYIAIAEYYRQVKSLWMKQVATEKDGGFWMQSDEQQKLKQEQDQRELRNERLSNYASTLVNFNGTGHRFAKRERFYGIAYSMTSGRVWQWSMDAWNMKQAYKDFGNRIKGWTAQQVKGKREAEEYYLFGNNRLLLSTLESDTNRAYLEDVTNITQSVIGAAFHFRRIQMPEGLLNPDKYKGYWQLLQDRETNGITMAKCGANYHTCYTDFTNVKTILTNGESDMHSRGVILGGPKEGIKQFSRPEDNIDKPDHWTLTNRLYALVGEQITKYCKDDFDSMAVPDESTAGFDLEPPSYPHQVKFHVLISYKRNYTNDHRLFMYDKQFNTKYIKKAYDAYNKPEKQGGWWNYGLNQNKEVYDVATVLMVDIDQFNSKIVLVNEPGQVLNDTRMFQNFGNLAKIKGFAPNNCKFSDQLKPEQGNTYSLLYRDTETNEITLVDTQTTNYHVAKKQAKDIKPKSTGEIWQVDPQQKLTNLFKNNKKPLGELELLGEWIFENCPDYQKIHPTDRELGLKTQYKS